MVRQDGGAQVGGNTGLKRCGQEMKMHHWVTSQGETVAKGISKGLEWSLSQELDKRCLRNWRAQKEV